ncbi:N-alpha-acetyltransferase 40 isoform X1 [Octopus bimaculoides]|uniref:N-alpha-acetyltransferase 40 isoform X1 n=1 Tax=Octopus bimaculoides TaxID=37653 RepID=UPI00071D1E0D|nr:N-alpha-acetyltransferase 40 isoform X1 [Octopus bimaculoides]|eukprot:XP_014786547.1 PREDICTED: N-alpha-acetyltransferase 40-like isoform X1 [Octopus bimaculoides]
MLSIIRRLRPREILTVTLQAQRRTAKSKEKRQKKLQEISRLKASIAKVEAANKLEDPLSMLMPFKKFERNGLDIKIECSKVSELDKETIDWAFQLTKSNMQSLYEASDWGWSDREKKTEMTEDKAWYLIARDLDSKKPVACVHFRFDLECDDEVLYCYEIQIMPEARRKGLGKFLMQILELLAHKTDMKKVMLTIFKHNPVGRDFFVNKLKYSVDEISPQTPLFEEEYCYEILSKIMPEKKPSVVEKAT